MTTKSIFLTLCGLLFSSLAVAQVKIGDNPGTLAPNTVLHVEKANNHMVVTTSGNVGIGTTTPQEKLHVLGGVTSSVGSFTGALWNGTSTADGAALYANGTLAAQRSGGANVAIGKPAGYTNGTFIGFAVNNSLVGSVVYNGTVMQYLTTSDVRLKTSIRPTRYALKDLMQIEVKDYSYKADKTHKAQTGFIAQQLHTVYPNAVTVGGADEKTNPWQVDYAKVTPLLVKAIQDQQAEIEALKKQNARLQTASAQATTEYNELKAEVAAIKALLQNTSSPAAANSATGK